MLRFTFKELEKALSERNSSYIYEDISSLLIGKKEVLWLSIESPEVSEPDTFAYRVIESIVEGIKPFKVTPSTIGEENYITYNLDETEIKVILDTPALSPFLKDKEFWLIEVRISGMSDYILAY